MDDTMPARVPYARYLTVGGAVVELRREADSDTARCTGCTERHQAYGPRDETDYSPADIVAHAERAARRYAQDHADYCRAMPELPAAVVLPLRQRLEAAAAAIGTLADQAYELYEPTDPDKVRGILHRQHATRLAQILELSDDRLLAEAEDALRWWRQQLEWRQAEDFPESALRATAYRTDAKLLGSALNRA